MNNKRNVTTVQSIWPSHNTILARLRDLLLLTVGSALFAAPAYAITTFTEAGLSNKGVAVSFSADFTISGGILTLVLTNTSPVDSINPDDTLSSFYFDQK